MSVRKVLPQFVAAALVMVLVGCGGGDGSGSDYAVIGDDPRTIVYQAIDEEFYFTGPEVSGALVWDRTTRCLYLKADGDMDATWLVIWPNGSRLVAVDGQPGVEVRGDRTRPLAEADEDAHVVQVGTRIDAGGAVIDDALLRRLTSSATDRSSVFGWVEEAQQESGCGTEYPVLLIDYISIPGGDG